MSIKQRLIKRSNAATVKNYRTAADDVAAQNNDEIAGYIALMDIDPDDVMFTAYDVASDMPNLDLVNKLLALVDLKLYNMYKDDDVAKVKQLLLADPEEGLTQENVDEYVEENYIDKDVLVTEKLSTHTVVPIDFSSTVGWDMFSDDCRELTKDDVKQITRIMLDSPKRDAFIDAIVD